MSNDDTPEIQSWTDPEMEARVVAWVTGEASEFEAAEMERIVAETPELEVFKRRIESVHGLVGAAFKSEGPGLRMSEERRSKLIERLGGNVETGAGAGVVVMGEGGGARNVNWWKRGIAIAACVAGVVLVAGILVPALTWVQLASVPKQSVMNTGQFKMAWNAAGSYGKKSGDVIGQSQQIGMNASGPLATTAKKVAGDVRMADALNAGVSNGIATAQNSEEMVTKEYPVAPGFNLASGGADETAPQDATAYLKSQGVQFPPGANAVYLPENHRLIVHNTASNSDLISKNLDSSGDDEKNRNIAPEQKATGDIAMNGANTYIGGTTVMNGGTLSFGVAGGGGGAANAPGSSAPETKSQLVEADEIAPAAASVAAAAPAAPSIPGLDEEPVAGVANTARREMAVSGAQDKDALGTAVRGPTLADYYRQPDSHARFWAGGQAASAAPVEAGSAAASASFSSAAVAKDEQFQEEADRPRAENYRGPAVQARIQAGSQSTIAALRSDSDETEKVVALPKAPGAPGAAQSVADLAITRNGANFADSSQQGEKESQADKSLHSFGLVGRYASATSAANAAPLLVDEIKAADEPFSTFSLHVSDVSFLLARAALAGGRLPDRESVRPEEFYNAFDYGDPAPGSGEQIGCKIEQAAHPELQERNLVRIAMKVAATGRGQGQALRLTVLLDTSGSMERADRAAAVRKAIEVLATLLGPQDEVTLVGFARQPRLLVDGLPGDQAGKLVDIVKRTPPQGGTNMEEAIKLAGEMAQRHEVAGAQNRIVMLTDGAANLGDANPDKLGDQVAALRQKGITFDACGVGGDGLEDDVLEALTRKGGGRYYLLNGPGDADAGFARQLAGALHPAAEDVKVQVRFNPGRVGSYKLIGFEKNRLKTEDFRNDKVTAAQLAAEEAGVAVYQVQALPEGDGAIGEVFVRFRDPESGRVTEQSWTIPYEAQTPALDKAAPSMQLATVSALMAEKLQGGPVGDAVDIDSLAQVVGQVRSHYAQQSRVQDLATMYQEMRRLEGK